MGVRGLFSYVGRQNLDQTRSFSNCKLVVDGQAFVNYIQDRYSINMLLPYDVLYQHVRDVCEQFAECGIQLLIIFQCCNLGALKLDTTERRMIEKTRRVKMMKKRIRNSQVVKELEEEHPILGSSCFVEALQSCENVECRQSEGENDEVVASVCAQDPEIEGVLSFDSDFYIFDIGEAYYIPFYVYEKKAEYRKKFNEFSFENGEFTTTVCRSLWVADSLFIPIEKLPLFACLNGNDSFADLEKFHKWLKWEYGRNRQVAVSRLLRDESVSALYIASKKISFFDDKIDMALAKYSTDLRNFDPENESTFCAVELKGECDPRILEAIRSCNFRSGTATRALCGCEVFFGVSGRIEDLYGKFNDFLKPQRYFLYELILAEEKRSHVTEARAIVSQLSRVEYARTTIKIPCRFDRNQLYDDEQQNYRIKIYLRCMLNGSKVKISNRLDMSHLPFAVCLLAVKNICDNSRFSGKFFHQKRTKKALRALALQYIYLSEEQESFYAEELIDQPLNADALQVFGLFQRMWKLSASINVLCNYAIDVERIPRVHEMINCELYFGMFERPDEVSHLLEKTSVTREVLFGLLES